MVLHFRAAHVGDDVIHESMIADGSLSALRQINRDDPFTDLARRMLRGI